MRPLELTLKNFLSYGNNEQTIDFSLHNIICLVGKNGHGKSALLEAITWVLWGQARKGQGVSKSDDMVMHIGSSDMFVILTLQIKEQKYKIKRTCEKKHNRLYTGLEVYIINNEEEKNLSLAHQKETQQLIDQIIGIDYDTFINTVYLKQGQSNEFSKKTPKERKDILCSILKINEIERIRQLLLDDIKILMQERFLQETLKERIKLTEKQKIKEECQKELDELSILYEKEQIAFIDIKQEYENTALGYNKIIEKEKNIEIDFQTKEKEYLDLYGQYKVLHNEYKRYKKYFFEIDKIEQENNLNFFLKNTTKEDIHSLENELKALRIIFEQQEKEDREEHQKNISTIEDKITQVEKEEDAIILKELESEAYHLKKLSTFFDKEGNRCFFCDTLYQKETKILLNRQEESYKKEQEMIAKKIEQYTTEKQEIKKKFLQQKEIYIQTNNENARALKLNFDRASELIQEKIREGKKKEELSLSAMKNTEKALIYKNEIQEIREKHLHKNLKMIIVSLIDIRQKKEALALMMSTILDQKNIAALLLKEKKTIFEESLKIEKEIEKKLYEKKYYLTLLEEELTNQTKELEGINQRKKDIEETLAIQSNLALILSKDQLQAALIEEAIPIIEYEANIILHKLTEGKFKIYIESMKDLKSGNIKETLDIKIADFLGIRYYEFFSGGESFKIDLALRIALVKLLAQKSGHSIKTFIIDEGFGSQDDQSLDIMIDVLHTLQNEFDLILIISHLSDMKEQFSGQFFIQKTTQGSTIVSL